MKSRPLTNRPITKQEVRDIKPRPFEPVLSYTRFANGQIVSKFHPAYSPPRYKREWSFTGTHSVKLPDGTTVERPGQYVVKMRRGI